MGRSETAETKAIFSLVLDFSLGALIARVLTTKSDGPR